MIRVQENVSNMKFYFGHPRNPSFFGSIKLYLIFFQKISPVLKAKILQTIFHSFLKDESTIHDT